MFPRPHFEPNVAGEGRSRTGVTEAVAELRQRFDAFRIRSLLLMARISARAFASSTRCRTTAGHQLVAADAWPWAAPQAQMSRTLSASATRWPSTRRRRFRWLEVERAEFVSHAASILPNRGL